MATQSDKSSKVTLLILGAGWTYQFLKPQLESQKITYAATTTSGHDKTILFKFDPDSDDLEPFEQLPNADFVLITFPLKTRGPSAKLLSMYHKTHDHSNSGESSKERGPKWIQLGSTGIFTHPGWSDDNAPINEEDARGIAETELIELGGCVMNLAGLYGGGREPRNWVGRVAKTKEQLGGKGALHLVHGWDVARGVLGLVKSESETGKGRLFGKRWIVADCTSYDWWSLAWDWMGESREESRTEESDAEEKLKYRRWVLELMEENNVKALPRSLDLVGRKLDSRGFWNAIGIIPERTLAR